MESGVINRDNLSSILRSLSQRRRQGVLEINEGEKQVRVWFFQGKIVEVLNGNVPPVREVAELLEDAGLVKGARAASFDNYRDLFTRLDSLSSGVPIDEVLFKRVIKHRVLNRAYDLENLSGAYYVFKVQMVEYERDFAPAIPVGQVLLDLVALDNETGRFTAAFRPGVVIRLGENVTQALSEEESALFELIGKGIGVEELRRKSMLSRYHFQDALLNMLDRGVVAVAATPAGLSVAEKLSSEELLSALDRSIDQAFREESELVKAAESFGDRAASGEKSVPGEAGRETTWVEPEEAEEMGAPGEFKMKLTRLSSWLGQEAWVPYGVVLIFAASATVLPFIVWREIFAYFTR